MKDEKIKRIRLENFLRELYEYKNFEDYCFNGLQVEGSDEIRNIILGVSLNNSFIDKAIDRRADAIIVHHGFFGKEFTSIRRRKKTMIEKLIKNDISLFGIHLPMDAHREIGHNALMFEQLNAEIKSEFSFGFIGKNIERHSLDDILTIFSSFLNTKITEKEDLNSPFNIYKKNSFSVVSNGPEIPDRIAIVSGGASSDYDKALALGVDTFFCGEIKEEIPSLSFDTKTNFINLGHYNSEKPGLIKLKEIIETELKLPTEFIDLPNPV